MSRGRRIAKRKRRKRNWMSVIILFVAVAGAACLVLWQQRGAAESSGQMAESAADDRTTSQLTDAEEADASASEAGDLTVQESTGAPGKEQSAEETSLPADDKGVSVDKTAARAEALLAQMTMEERIYQMFIVTPEQLTGETVVTQAGESFETALHDCPVGGMILFAKNLKNRNQCIEMISDFQSYSRLGLFVGTDEEGGTVERVGSNSAMGGTSFPDMGTIGASGDTEQAYQVGFLIGTELAELGLNLDFAPVADVNSNPDNPVIGTRSFSSDPKLAAEMVKACVKGFRESGILCSLKHFPGHGDTDTDSHYGTATTDKTLENLEQCEFLPFQAGIDAGAPLVMVGHISAPNVTEQKVPATLSYELITEILREQMGFQGIVITDSMSMRAITDYYSSGEAAVMAVEAGVDVILMPANLSDAVKGIEEAVDSGRITEERINESVLRILKAKIRAGIIADTETEQSDSSVEQFLS